MHTEQTPIWIKRRIQRLIDKGADARIAHKSFSTIVRKLQKSQKDAKIASNVIPVPSMASLRTVEIITA